MFAAKVSLMEIVYFLWWTNIGIVVLLYAQDFFVLNIFFDGYSKNKEGV